MSKDDPRFCVTDDRYALAYEGDPDAVPGSGINYRRKQWKTWVIFLVPITSRKQQALIRRSIFIDTYDGKRMACLGKTVQGMVAIRVGREGGIIRIAKIAEYRYYVSSHCTLVPKFRARWKENDEWLLLTPQSDVHFI